MPYEKITVVGTDSIHEMIKCLSFGGNGCLSLYWEICKRESINARDFIDYFPVGSRAFRSKYHLWENSENYQKNRWIWIKEILTVLRKYGLVTIEPLNNKSKLDSHAEADSENFDYALKPRVSEIIFEFRRDGNRISMTELEAAHKFIMNFVPRHISPRGIPKKVLRNLTQRKIEKSRDIAEIVFPIACNENETPVMPQKSSEDSNSDLKLAPGYNYTWPDKVNLIPSGPHSGGGGRRPHPVNWNEPSPLHESADEIPKERRKPLRGGWKRLK